MGHTPEVDLSGLQAAADRICAEVDRLCEINAELLEALEGLINRSLDMRDAWDQDDAYINFDNAIDQARAAIAKATGEAS